MWGRDNDATEDCDTWEQQVWFITHHAITIRKQKLENSDQQTPSELDALHILKWAEIMINIADNPSSITTVMPRRLLRTWDLNAMSRKSKTETI